MKKVMALFQDYDAAELVVEGLLDAGFSQKDISLMSGNYWQEELLASGRRSNQWVVSKENPGIILQVLESTPARIARELVCNSGAIDVCECEVKEATAWTNQVLPLNLPQPVEQYIHGK